MPETRALMFHSAKMRSPLLALCGLLLAGCSGSSWGSKPDAPENPILAPTNYRTEILNQLQVTLDDPSGVREAFIAEPMLKPSGNETRYIGCVRYNARDKDGKYLGLKEKAAFFYAGHLTTMLDATKEQCAAA